MSARLAATYRRAAEILRIDGWCQEDFEWAGSYCAVGAVRKAQGLKATPVAGLGGDDTAYTVLADMLGLVRHASTGGTYAGEIIQWNDAENRTKGDVITLLEQAAEKLEADLT